jgi:CrcB protein
VARFLLICLGGALGTGARYLVATWAAGTFGAAFPAGTLLVYASGSFLIALVMELAALTGGVPEDLRLFLTTGMMGGLTTYSSFNYETLRLAQSGAVAVALLNLGATVLVCAASGVLGFYAARGLAHFGAALAGSGGP